VSADNGLKLGNLRLSWSLSAGQLARNFRAWFRISGHRSRLMSSASDTWFGADLLPFDFCPKTLMYRCPTWKKSARSARCLLYFQDSYLNSRRSSLGQFLAIASIKWSTCIFTFIRSAVPITKIFAAFSLEKIEFQRLSVTCGMPDNAKPRDERNFELNWQIRKLLTLQLQTVNVHKIE